MIALLPDRTTRTPQWRWVFPLAFLLLVAGTALAADAPRNRTHHEAAVLEHLLRGEDPAEAIARLQRAQHAPAAAGKQRSAPRHGAIHRVSTAIEALSASLRLPVRDPADTVRRRRDLEAALLLLDAEFDGLAARLPQAPTSAILARAASTKQRWHDAIAPLRTAMRQLGTDDERQRDLAARALVDWWQAQRQRQSPPVLGGSLPVHRPRLLPRVVFEGPGIAPSYASGGIEVEPLTDDRIGRDETRITPAIAEKAAALGHDYIAIFDFVRTQVRTQWYAGAQKSADETLRTLAGNDIDQASLLIALLRASSASARYVTGVVEVPVEALGDQLGVPAPRVGAALAAAGVAHAPVIEAGQVAAFRIEQVWVAAHVPYDAYRGTAAEATQLSWIPLMPALKPYAFEVAGNVLDPAALDIATWIESFLAEPAEALPWPTLREELAVRLAQRSPPVILEEQRAIHVVTAEPLGLLPASTPFPVVTVAGEEANLLAEQRQFVQVTVRDPAAPDSQGLLTARWPIAAVAQRRIGIGFAPAAVEDQHLANASGGLDQVPPYLIHVRPVVWIDGQVATTGHGSVGSGAALTLELQLEGPAGLVEASQSLRAGGIAALSLDPQGDAPAIQNRDEQATEPRAADLLAGLAQRYQAAWSEADRDNSGLLGLSLIRPLPAVALVLAQYRVDEVAGLATTLEFEGVALDAMLRPVEPISQRADVAAERDWLDMSALHGSAAESKVFESDWRVDALSADVMLQRARADQLPVLALEPGDPVAAQLAAHAPHVVDAVQSWLDRGMDVQIPRDPIAIEDWRGSGWQVRNPASGESGWYVSGGYAGGVSIILPSRWYIKSLAEILSNPYGSEPNDDPLSAHLIQLDRSADQQRGPAGQPMPKPLAAYVTDATGRPVRGAEVRFRVELGGGSLEAGATRATTVTVPTDARGVARVTFHSPQELDGTGSLVQEDGKPFPQWMLINSIGVQVPTPAGPLVAEQPFRVLTHPAAPASVELAAHNDLWRVVPGLGAREFTVFARDAFDNFISNVDVDLSVEDEFETPQCTGHGMDAAPPSELFEIGACPSDAIVFTGLGCTQDSLRTVTRPVGVRLGLVTTPVVAARVTLRASIQTGDEQTGFGTASDEVEFENAGTTPVGASGEPCSEQPWFGLLQWYFPHVGDSAMDVTSVHADLTSGFVTSTMEATLPNTVLPVSRRVTMVEATSRGVLDWTAPRAPSIQQIELMGAEAVNIRTTGAIAEYDILAGPAAREIEGNLVLRIEDDIWHARIPSAWIVEVSPPVIDPPFLALDPQSLTTTNLRLEASFDPPEYLSRSTRIQTRQGDETGLTCINPMVRSPSECNYTRGLRFPDGEPHRAQTTLNAGTPFELQSPEVELKFARGLMGGFVADNSPGPATDVDVFGAFPEELQLNHSYDAAADYLCDQSLRLVYLLEQEARVSLTVYNLDENGERTTQEKALIHDEVRPAGVHELEIGIWDLPYGTFEYEWEVVSTADGSRETHKGLITNQLDVSGALPLAHSFVKGVDLFDGGAVLSEEDAAIGGRGPGLRFTRTYSTHRGNEEGFLGRGWSSPLEARLVRDRCGGVMVMGSAGQGQRFVIGQTGTDGSADYQPLGGYHSSLRRDAQGHFDFYSKDGTRYRLDGLNGRLEFVEDPNGNRVTYSYDPLVSNVVTRISDGAGRSLDFNYALTRLPDRLAGDVTVTKTQYLLTEIEGPLGLRVCYDYDADGNLTSARRVTSESCDAVQFEEVVSEQQYEYENFGYVAIVTRSGGIGLQRLGHRLKSVTDAIRQATRRYEYRRDWISEPNPGTGVTPALLAQLRVERVTEPDEGETEFAYEGDRGVGGGVTTVTDARGHDTLYTLNPQGAAILVVDSVGTTTTTWDLEAMQPATITDAIGTETYFEYDSHGNTSLKRVVHDDGEHLETWTFVAPNHFDVPIKNRPSIHEDAGERSTLRMWDARGNLIGVSRGDAGESYGVDARGDRITRTDGKGHVTTYVWDEYGHVVSESDDLGPVRSASFDQRGRQVQETDGAGERTEFEYDPLDRVILTRHPAAATGLAGTSRRAETRTLFIDHVRRRVDIDALDRTTTTDFDAMGRQVQITNADNGTRHFTYDANGNLLSESSFRGHVTTHLYDEANRRIETRAPLGRTTRFVHDPLGHVLSETTGAFVSETELADARRIEYRYADPAYRRTHVRVQVADEFLETRTRYDGSGNAVETVDPRGKITTRNFDARDRLQTQLEPEGRTLSYTYDGADNRLSETLSGPGLAAPQVRTFVPDGRDRERRRVDATGGAWETEYDVAGRISRRIDPRLNAVSYRYDARGRLVEEAGPVPGRITRYGVDAVGNRTDEVHANGRAIVHDFDALNRRVASRDTEGDFERPEFERLAYDEDGHVVSRTDANGNVTTYVIDALGRTTAEQRPLGRSLGWTHTIHGEVATETDGEGATTTHQYDGAGRRVLTTAPAPFAYETRVAYDAAGNPIAQTDGRGLTTDRTFDDLNRLVSQTDPAIGAERYVQTWAYDAAGNTIAHVDRRGIEHRAEFDGENRELVRRRDGVLQVTRTFDAAGNLVGEIDAGGHLTTHAYNGANERTKSTRPENAVETWAYLPWGDVETQTEADGITTRFGYDLRRRVISETRPHADGPAVTTHAFDGQGNRIETTRPLGPSYRWQYRFDAAHRLDQVTSPEGAVTQYEYDRADRRTRITDAEERPTTTAFDALGRVTRVDFANGDAERIDSYDANGNITARTDGNGQSIASQFDALNRITERSYHGAAQPDDVIRETWAYTPNGEATRLGQHTADGTEYVTQRAWDRQGRLTEDTNRHGQLTEHVYDDDGVRLRRTDAAGATVFQPDALHRIRSVQPAGETPIAIEVTPGGRLQSQTPPNGATTTHTYDAGGRIATITHRQHGTVVATLTYVYDLNGNRERETHVAPTGTRTTTYVYDRDDRLTGTTLTDDAGVETATVYSLDAVGNRLTEVVTVDGVVTANKTYTYSPRHQLETVTDSVASTATTYTYDDNGFTTSETVNGQTTTYRPNLQDRLATLTTPTGPPVHYAYDPDGLRVEKRTSAEATRYGYDGQSLRRETNVANNPLATYDWASGRVLRTHRAGQTSYAQHDALKSPIRWSRADGAEQGRATFDAWGNRTNQTGTLPPITFTGYYADAESEHYYAQQRYYLPGLGRFNRVDPWAGDALRPITHGSKYLYANGNPLRFVDPDGRAGMETPLEHYYAAAAATHDEESRRLLLEAAQEFEHARDVAGAPLVGIAEVGVEGLLASAEQAMLSQRAQLGDPQALMAQWQQGKALAGMALNPGRTWDQATLKYSDEFSRINELEALGDIEGANRQRGRVVAPFFYAVASLLRIPKAIDAATPAKPLVVTERSSSSPASQFNDAAVIDELDAAYGAAARGIDPDYGSGKGRRGTKETREHIDIVRDQFLDANPEYKHIAGGTDRLTGAQLPEEYIRAANGGRRGSSFADLTFEAPDGSRIRINTVDADDMGVMTPREQANFDRIFDQTGEPIIAEPKPTPIPRKRP